VNSPLPSPHQTKKLPLATGILLKVILAIDLIMVLLLNARTKRERKKKRILDPMVGKMPPIACCQHIAALSQVWCLRLIIRAPTS
jgi:hypothetical protein